MSQFTINFLNFGVFVHHSAGVTLVLGADGHSLKYGLGKHATTSLDPGTAVTLRVRENDKDVNLGATESQTDLYMVDLDWMFGRTQLIDRARVLGSTTDDQNGRIHLHGGKLFDHPAGDLTTPHQLPELLWDFSEFGARSPALHRITNRASFVQEVHAGRKYSLEFSSGTTIELQADSQITFENADDDEENCNNLLEKGAGTIDRELVRLLPAIGINPGRANSRLNTQITMGLGKICQPCTLLESRQEY